VTSLFPMFVKLEGRRCLVVGAGRVGEPKIQSLLESGADLRVIALEASERVQELARERKIRLELRTFVQEDLDGIFLLVVATSSSSLNESIYREAQRCGILCNVVDDPPHCDFFYPAIVRRGALQIAVSTSGRSPSLAQKIRQQLERQFGEDYAQWVEELGETRRQILTSDLDAKQKKELLSSLASRNAFEATLAQHRQTTNKPEQNEDHMEEERIV
jgi:precorrin-2 dehydrogenase / sirohydrochlorin ferrochelatase